MPYVNAEGKVIEKRSNFRLSIISDIFWTVFDVIGIFVQTLFYPSYRPPPNRPSSSSRTSSSSSTTTRRGPNVRGLRPTGEMNCAAGG